MSESACPVHAGFDLKEFPQMNTASHLRVRGANGSFLNSLLNTTHYCAQAFLHSVLLALCYHTCSAFRCQIWVAAFGWWHGAGPHVDIM